MTSINSDSTLFDVEKQAGSAQITRYISDQPDASRPIHCSICAEPAPMGTKYCPHCQSKLDSIPLENQEPEFFSQDEVNRKYDRFESELFPPRLKERCLSFVINVGIFGAVMALPSQILNFSISGNSPEPLIYLFINWTWDLANYLGVGYSIPDFLLNFSPLLILFFLFDACMWHHSPGKRLNGLFVVNYRKKSKDGLYYADTSPSGFWKVFLRTILKYATIVFTILENLPNFSDGDYKDPLHDRILGTRVVRIDTGERFNHRKKLTGWKSRLLSNTVFVSIFGGLLAFPDPFDLFKGESRFPSRFEEHLMHLDSFEKFLPNILWFCVPILFLMLVEILFCDDHPGKKLYGLWVVETRGEIRPIGFWKNALRCLIKWTISIPAIIPLAFFRERFWLHDLILGTRVVERMIPEGDVK
jgi:uncharacterized RDD family membrane protein YckC